MKTLLIDNGSTLTKKLGELSPGEEVIVSYDEIPDDLSAYSLILLSGSSKFPVYGNEDKFSRELNLIRSTNTPVVGICLGHELIAHAFNSPLTHFNKQHVGITTVNVIEKHFMFKDRGSFSVYENHQYGVTKVSDELIALAETDHAIAVIKHREKPIYGFQFHPEHHAEKQLGDEIFLALFKELISK